jgi:hypothetical protein
LRRAAYPGLFDRVLMAVYCRVPEKAMGCITGTSPALVKEHLELAKKQFPDPDAIKNYLVSRGVKVEELASGAQLYPCWVRTASDVTVAHPGRLCFGENAGKAGG